MMMFDLFSQFWAVLYKLLQWEAAAAFHPADPEVRAGGVRDGRDWSNSTTILIFSWHLWLTLILMCKNILTYNKNCLSIPSLFSYAQWEPVPYFNNKIICDLVEEKHRGIISLLVKIWLSYGPTERQKNAQKTKMMMLFLVYRTRNVYVQERPQISRYWRRWRKRSVVTLILSRKINTYTFHKVHMVKGHDPAANPAHGITINIKIKYS